LESIAFEALEQAKEGADGNTICSMVEERVLEFGFTDSQKECLQKYAECLDRNQGSVIKQQNCLTDLLMCGSPRTIVVRAEISAVIEFRK
jgi:hypothetical protein